MQRLIYIFIVVDIVLLTVALCVWLMPERQVTQPSAMIITSAPDSLTHIDPREQQKPETITASSSSANIHDHSDKSLPTTLPASSSPFYSEAQKILSAKLSEDDADNRRVILNYCEHLRSAYTTKDIDFLRQVFSERALIVVGNVVREQPKTGMKPDLPDDKIKFFVRTKQQYLQHIQKVFSRNETIDVKFSDFRILRHPTHEGIYGVTLRQQYDSDRYSDDGRLFLLWDFRNPSMPLIHVRVWQPEESISTNDDIISLSDFNLE